jgi:hypothetical protein
MGNDIFSTFMNKQKLMNFRLAEIFLKYTTQDKNKSNKTIEKIIDIYINLFYYNENQDLSELDNYFLMNNSNDILLKKILLSTIIFYKQNDMEDKIERDIGKIIIISNSIYLSLVLGNISKYDDDLEKMFDSFFTKYKNKIRIKEETVIIELKQELFSILKTEMAYFKKFFKLFNEIKYSLSFEQIFDCNYGFMVNLSYDIKMLSKYSLKEIEQVKNNKGINLENNIITLELTVLQLIKDMIAGNVNNKYFIDIEMACLEKPKYRQAIENILNNEILKSKIVFILNYNSLKAHQKTIVDLTSKNYLIGVKNVNDLKVTKTSFDNIKYVFVSPQFLEYHDGYLEIWKVKDTKFIVSGGYNE